MEVVVLRQLVWRSEVQPRGTDGLPAQHSGAGGEVCKVVLIEIFKQKCLPNECYDLLVDAGGEALFLIALDVDYIFPIID